MNLVLGVTGSISAYKAVEILRIFQKNGHNVSVIMTRGAKKFISPLTFETFIPGKVYFELFKEDQDPVLHINISRNNDLLLIAPATANIIGKIANGIADDLLSTTFLAFYGKIVIAPAMNSFMYENMAVTENIARLKSRGVEVIEPEKGELACKDDAKGRLASYNRIYEYCVGIKSV